MDEADIGHSLLVAGRAGDPARQGSFEIPYEKVAALCAAHPDRSSGLAGADPTRGMRQLRDLHDAADRPQARRAGDSGACAAAAEPAVDHAGQRHTHLSENGVSAFTQTIGASD